MREDTIKACLIDHLIKQQGHDNHTLLAEFPFADRVRRADIALLNKHGLTAFEIKSSFDNLEKLPHQIDDYLLTFDFLFIVVAAPHLSLATTLAPRGVGLILFENNEIRIIRKATQRKRLSKSNLLSILTKQELSFLCNQKEIKIKSHAKQNKHELIDLMSKNLNICTTRIITHKYIEQKYNSRYRFFLKERGDVTTSDDLYLLTSEQGDSLL